ncbi:MAG: TetR/AcrR family transcriptional regulator [Solirubrobacterales bacterium]
MPRLSNKEKRAETRRCLMTAAARAFARHGLERTSIDQVAEDAGFTKGAFYANFKNKKELFLAMLDERFGERMEEIERVIAGEGTASEKASRAGEDFASMLEANPDWNRLFFEFNSYANRDEEFREELLTRYRWMRERLARALEARAEELGLPPSLSGEQLATMAIAIGNGFALEAMLEPEAVPAGTLGTMLTIFFAGVRSLEGPPAGTAAGEASR